MLMQLHNVGRENGYKVSQIDLQRAEPVGIKSVTLEFEGDYAYGNLKSENGVHRLVNFHMIQMQKDIQLLHLYLYIL